MCVSTQQLEGSGGMLPQEVFEIRCSEITSEALLGQKLPLENFLSYTVVPGRVAGAINAVWERRAGNTTTNE